MQQPQPNGLNPFVAEALRKFEEGTDPSELTLEEIMMCKYQKPCARISPSELNDTRYGWGSVLVFADRVLLVLNPEDETVYVPADGKRSRFIGPNRRFKGLLDGSRFYTKETITYVIGEANRVRDWREVVRERVSIVGVSVMSIFRARCSEEMRLAGRRDAQHFKTMFAGQG